MGRRSRLVPAIPRGKDARHRGKSNWAIPRLQPEVNLEAPPVELMRT